MIEGLGLYCTFIVALLVVGCAVRAVATPTQRWLDATALPIGAGATLVAVYPLGFLLPTRIAGPVVLVVAAGALVVSGARVVRSHSEGRQLLAARLRPDRTSAAVLGFGAVVGTLLLRPILSLGEVTTVGVSVFDGWARATFTDWVLANPTRVAGSTGKAIPPLGSYESPPTELAVGFEHLAGLLAAITGAEGFQVVAIVAATSVPVAAAGLFGLLRALGAAPRWWAAIPLAFAAASPAMAFLQADTYFTQAFSVALVPFAAAATVNVARRPGLREGLVATTAIAAVVGVYPPMLPWLIPVIAVACLLGADWKVRRAALVGACLTAAVPLLAPLQTLRAVASIETVSGLRSNAAFPLFPWDTRIAFSLGADSPFAHAPFGLGGGWPLATLGAVVAALIAVGAVATLAGARDRAAAAALMLAVALPTVLLGLRFTFQGYGYGAIKAAASGGALFCGVVVVALLLPRARALSTPCFALAGLLCVMWFTGSAQIMSLPAQRAVGFHPDDLALRSELNELPPGSSILFAGVEPTPEAFQARAVLAYFDRNDPRYGAQGLGTTQSYMAGGGGAEWRPSEAWDYVVVAPAAPGWRRVVVTARRRHVLAEAPDLDITRFGNHWVPRQPGAPIVVDGLTGPAEWIISNRTDAVRRYRITARARGSAGPHTLTIDDGRRNRVVQVPSGRVTALSFTSTIGGRTALPVSLIPSGTESTTVGFVELVDVRIEPVP